MTSIDRRSLFGVTMAAGSMMATSMKAHAKFADDVQLRDQIGELERLPTLGLESRENYRTAFRKFVNSDLRAAADRRAATIFKEVGLDPNEPASMTQVVKLLENDPILMSHLHAFLAVQQSMWVDLQDVFHSNADQFLTEMDRSDKAGPGSLELNPGLKIPDYAAWEIHNMPGGYVGDPFAGHMYHYGTNNFFMHLNEEERIHKAVANSTPVPTDGKVHRCLDLGTSVGQTALHLKRRFPDAEVWGIDVGAPMVRYAHMRAADLGDNINFAQRLAEDSGFPDNHFDTVTSYLLFHEVSREATHEIIKEIHRVLRPGGTFYSPEGMFTTTKAKKTAASQWRIWWNDEWCSEVHYIPYTEYDYEKAFSDAGFEIGSTIGPFGNEYMIGRKKA